ncbi:uncharacterized protein LOC135221157 [Macrobrachium nipponense]|uniref:uncharacterized protein LOC135221157 n=1 Tax=Macrobrachium nipponense TaxID=159736 RepID=UPI0030C7ED85
MKKGPYANKKYAIETTDEDTEYARKRNKRVREIGENSGILCRNLSPTRKRIRVAGKDRPETSPLNYSGEEAVDVDMPLVDSASPPRQLRKPDKVSVTPAKKIPYNLRPRILGKQGLMANKKYAIETTDEDTEYARKKNKRVREIGENSGISCRNLSPTRKRIRVAGKSGTEQGGEVSNLKMTLVALLWLKAELFPYLFEVLIDVLRVISDGTTYCVNHTIGTTSWCSPYHLAGGETPVSPMRERLFSESSNTDGNK